MNIQVYRQCYAIFNCCDIFFCVQEYSMLGCFKKEKVIPITATIDELLLIVWNEDPKISLGKIFQHRDNVPGAHDLILTLLHYESDTRVGAARPYYDQFVDFILAIEEAENFVKNISKNPKNIVTVTPRTSKRISTQLMYNYIVTKNKNILDSLCDTADYDSDMYRVYNKLNNILG